LPHLHRLLSLYYKLLNLPFAPLLFPPLFPNLTLRHPAQLNNFYLQKIGKLLRHPIIQPTKYSRDNNGFIAEFLFVEVHDFLGLGGGLLSEEEFVVEFDDFEDEFALV
jgi:hypothetical protein